MLELNYIQKIFQNNMKVAYYCTIFHNLIKLSNTQIMFQLLKLLHSFQFFYPTIQGNLNKV